MSGLEQLYQQVILDHSRERHGYGPAAVQGPVAARSEQYNPLCGDEVALELRLDGPAPEGRVVEVAWTGDGCSISQASVSVLHDLVVGQDEAGARALIDEFRSMIRSRGTDPGDEEVLGDAVAFSGVGRHANRVKCAMLGWTALEDALNRAASTAATAEQEEEAS